MSGALRRTRRGPGLVGGISTLAALALTACTAAPPLQLYMLSKPSADQVSTALSDPPPAKGALLIEVARVRLPDYLDSRDLFVRQGYILKRSSTGRWASRLSIAATDLLTARLTMHRPDAWVTDQPQAQRADYRLLMDVSQLDITSSGMGVVQADWEIIPRCSSTQVIRGRAGFAMRGAVATDQDVARFERALLVRLADQIDVDSWPSPCSTGTAASGAPEPRRGAAAVRALHVAGESQ